MFDQFSVQLSPKEPLPFLVKLSVWSWPALCNWSWPTWCKEIDLGLRCCHVLQDPVQVQMDQKSQAKLLVEIWGLHWPEVVGVEVGSTGAGGLVDLVPWSEMCNVLMVMVMVAVMAIVMVRVIVVVMTTEHHNHHRLDHLFHVHWHWHWHSGLLMQRRVEAWSRRSQSSSTLDFNDGM